MEEEGCKMKRLFSILTVALLCVVLVGCGRRCYVCGKNGARYELVGYSLCRDCYMTVMEGIEEDLPQDGTGDTGATMGERNALESALDYLDVLSFSYSGLIEQLEYEGYSTSEATYAADHCGADWYEQAALSAKEYLEIASFSRQSLIEQLEFENHKIMSDYCSP